ENGSLSGRNRDRERADSRPESNVPGRFPYGTIRPRLLQWRVQRDRHDGEGQQAIHENQRLGLLHLRPPSVAVRRGGGGVANQRMRRMPRRQRREDGYDLDSVLSAAPRQSRLLISTEEREHAGHEHVEGNGDDGAEWSKRASLHANERNPKCHRSLSEV